MPLTESFVSLPPADKLLAWYRRNRRHLPWRAAPGAFANPYHVWLSEIMLQQTTVAAVIPYFQRFVTRYPRINALAMAPEDEVLGLWAGLGYYARARNLIACARAVTARGGFPNTVEGLRTLPGIGAYTAAAIGAIAFNWPVVPVDGNVERVVARIFVINAPLPGVKLAFAEAAAHLMKDASAASAPGDFAQALFDLGATLCTPRNPSCLICPWTNDCAAHRLGLEKELPQRAVKKPRPVRHGIVYLMQDGQGNIGLQRRPAKGLLGGMLGLPGPDWVEPPMPIMPPAAASWLEAGMVRHVFTHFALELQVYAARTASLPDDLLSLPADTPLPSVMRKAAELGLATLKANVQE